MNPFDETVIRWRVELQQLYVVSIEITHVSEVLHNASSKMKIIAINGMVQASRALNQGGRVFSTLASFLSKTPSDISAIIKELEYLFVNLIRNSNKSLDMIRKLSNYIQALHWIRHRVDETGAMYLNLDSFNSIHNFMMGLSDDNFSKVEKENVDNLLLKLNEKKDQIIVNVHESSSLLKSALTKINHLKHLSLSTRYLGTNVSTEAAKYSAGQYFVILGKDISKLIDSLDDSIEQLENSVVRGVGQLGRFSIH